MLLHAIECVVEAGMASTSLLQRRLQIRYKAGLLLSQICLDQWPEPEFFYHHLFDKLNGRPMVLWSKDTDPVAFHIVVFYIKFPAVIRL